MQLRILGKSDFDSHKVCSKWSKLIKMAATTGGSKAQIVGIAETWQNEPETSHWD